jgi:hypothetical protein
VENMVRSGKLGALWKTWRALENMARSGQLGANRKGKRGANGKLAKLPR